MPPNNVDSLAIARIDERTRAQQASFDSHTKEDSEKFDRMFNYLTIQFDKVDDRFEKLDEKLGTLWDENNSRKGAFNASRLAGAGIWACVVLVAGYFLPGK